MVFLLKKKVNLAKKYIALNLNYAETYFKRGTLHVEMGTFGQAVEDFDRSIELDPTKPDVFNNRSYVHLKLNNFVKAINDSSAAIKLDPNNSNAFANRCAARVKIRRFSQAIWDCERSLQLDCDNPLTYYQLALAYKGSGDRGLAVRNYSYALELDPSLPQAMDDLMRVSGQ